MRLLKNRSFLAAGASLVSATAMLLPLDAAFAQDASAQSPDASSGGLQEIIVTAQKRAEPLQDVPVSVSAFSSEMLQNARVDGLVGLRGLVPGMTITRSGAAVDVPQISLRGISIQDVLPSVEAGIGITLDGIPVAFQRGALIDAFDVERVEILRGPQGVLAGKNTTGGTINVIRIRPNPNQDATGKVRVTVGSFGQNDYEGYVMAPVISGILAVKAGITVKKNNGQFKNIVTGSHEGDKDLRQYNLSAVLTPSDRSSFYVAFDRIENDSQISPYTPVNIPDTIFYPIPGYTGGNNITCANPFTSVVCQPLSQLDKEQNYVETTQMPASLRLTAITGEARFEAMDDINLVSVTGYREFTEKQVSDFDATRFALFRDPARVDAHQFSQEGRIETSFSGPFNIVADAFYMKYSYTEHQNPSLDLAGADPTVPPGVAFLNSVNQYLTNQHNRSFALFAQADYDVTDQLRLTVGGRQTWDKKSTDYTQYDFVFGATRDLNAQGPLVGNVANSAKFKKFTPKVNLQYKLNPDVLAYATWSRGYNTGGFNGRPGNIVTAVQAYLPETMNAYELGLKSEFFNRRVRLNISAFHNTLSDKQENILQVVAVPGGGLINATTTLNAAKARYQGVEVELGLAPVRGWTISGSLGYLDAKYKSFFGNLGQGAADLTGLKLRRTPKWTGGFISDYTFAAGPGQVGLNAALVYTSRYETDVLNDPRASIPPVTKIDLGVRYEFPVHDGLDLELAGFVKNVTDNTTYDGYTSGDAQGSFIDWANPTVGRTWGVSLGARF